MMARKTAEQRRQEQAAAQQAQVDQFNETFELRVLRVLNQVRSLSGRLSGKFEVELQSQALNTEEATLPELQESMNFCLSWFDEWNDRQQVILPAFRFKANDYNEAWHWDLALNELEQEVEEELERQAEAKRQAELRASALSKLSDEERAALNL